MKRLAKLVIFAVAAFSLAACCNGKDNGPKVITPKAGQSEIEMKVGDTLKISGTSHASVGLSFRIEFDNQGFEPSVLKNYENPEAIEAGMVGADKAELVYSLAAKKEGEYRVAAIETFRGQIQKENTYTVAVK